MSRNQTTITAGPRGFLSCTVVFVISLVEQFAYIEVAPVSLLGWSFFIAGMPIPEAFDDKQAASPVPRFFGAVLTVSVVPLYAIRHHFSAS